MMIDAPTPTPVNYSWRTSLAALCTILTTVFFLIVTPLVDNDPKTNPDYNTAIPIIALALGLHQAKDDADEGQASVQKSVRLEKSKKPI